VSFKSLGDPAVLLELAEARMPFGKHKGRRLLDLPEPYVVWLAGQGFPKGRLGMLLGLVHEVKVNGLEHLFVPLRGKPR
jgi:uncharacterized protein (DUF3820 family)